MLPLTLALLSITQPAVIAPYQDITIPHTQFWCQHENQRRHSTRKTV